MRRLFTREKTSYSSNAALDDLTVLLGGDGKLIEQGKKKLIGKSMPKTMVQYEDICDYVADCPRILRDAQNSGKIIVFVCGHSNADADSVVSSIFEAYRLQLRKTENTVFIPLIRAEMLPSEVVSLLGADIYPELIYESDINPIRIMETNEVRYVLTDTISDEMINGFVLAATDHHIGDASKKKDGVAYTIENCGSTTALIVAKYLAEDIFFESPLAQILYGAMLLETENRDASRMTAFDKDIMDLMKQKACVDFDSELYSELMREMLSETDVATLYYRDYRAVGNVGYSTIKVSDFIDKDSFAKKMKTFVSMAIENNRENNLQATFIKVSEYARDGLRVIRERIYVVFNNVAKEVQNKLAEVLKALIQDTFPEAQVLYDPGYIEISGAIGHLSEKAVAPIISQVINA